MTAEILTAGGVRGIKLRFATIEALAPQMAGGTLSSATLVRGALDAIDADDAKLSAIRWLNPQAEAQARRLDEERGRRGVRGPLHGLPIVIKDNIDLAGAPTTAGARALERAIALADAEQVRRFKAAGAVILAKTNLSEFSFDIRSRSTLGGDVCNAFNLEVTAGGSSGGTAAAVAAGFAVAGLGTDTGGSIRVPASFNGLVGLRPTQGLIDISGVMPLAPTTDTIGPMARSVADVAVMLAVMADTSSLQETSSPREPLAGARIGVLGEFLGKDPAIGDAVSAALGVLAQGGAILVPGLRLPPGLLPHGRDNVVDWEFGFALQTYLQASFTGVSTPSLAALCDRADLLEDHREAFRRRAGVKSLDQNAYRAVLAYHGQLRSALEELMQASKLDVLAYPTSPVIPASLEKPQGVWAPELAACTGWPALTLPVGRAPNGVPIGLELLGRAFDERRLLDMAGALERRLDLRLRPSFI